MTVQDTYGEVSEGKYSLQFDYEPPNKKMHITRIWHASPSDEMGIVEWIGIEKYYDHTDEKWKQANHFTCEYDIDENERLVGDGSNWSGEGQLWREYARERHRTLLEKRFQYIKFSDE